jgi:predicted kinase
MTDWRTRSPDGFGVHTLVVLMGLPGCGKTTTALVMTDYLGFTAVSPDAIAQQRYGSVAAARRQRAMGHVFDTAHAELRGLLASGRSVVFDATSLEADLREQLTRIAAELNVARRMLIAWSDVEAARRRNEARTHPQRVPDDAFAGFAELVGPALADVAHMEREGWVVIRVTDHSSGPLFDPDPWNLEGLLAARLR